MSRRWLTHALLLLPALLATVPSRAAEPPQAAWREGPVRYIITTEEDREYRALGSDADRARFIQRFWARRDPNHRTLINEYRHAFWTRVADANRLFTESAKPGWKTDMGRYYILLGPPDDRDTSQEFGQGFGRTGVRGAIIWRYSHAPTDRIGTGVTIPFVRDGSGEFRATTDPAIVSQILNAPLAIDDRNLSAFGINLQELPPRLTELELMLDLGRLEEVPSPEELLTAIVTAEEFYGVIPFSARYDFFAGRDDTTIVVVTLNLHPDPFDPARKPTAPDYLIVGRLEPEEIAGTAEGEAIATYVRESDFDPSPHNTGPGYRGPYIYQAVLALAPSRYRASFAAFDRATRKTGAYSELLDVPAFAQGTLSLSSLCLSENIEPASRHEARGAAPYVIGNLKVTPRLIPSYHNGETFAVYYQVYSAVDDPRTATPDLRIEYQFLVRQGETFIPIGRPITFESVGNSAQGWSFPLRDWPAADFKLRVKITDALTGQSASREVAFKVL